MYRYRAGFVGQSNYTQKGRIKLTGQVHAEKR